MNRIVLAGLLIACVHASHGRAAEACSAYMTNVEAELELFANAPDAIDAGRDAKAAPELEMARLYQVRLRPQDKVSYLKTAARQPVDTAKPGGLLRFVAPAAGKYRVAADANFWIDMVFDGEPLASTDFRSDRECKGPRKIVTFALPAGAEVYIQLIDAPATAVRLTVTPEPPKDW